MESLSVFAQHVCNSTICVTINIKQFLASELNNFCYDNQYLWTIHVQIEMQGSSIYTIANWFERDRQIYDMITWFVDNLEENEQVSP